MSGAKVGPARRGAAVRRARDRLRVASLAPWSYGRATCRARSRRSTASRSGICLPASASTDLNLLLVTLDTTRADRIHAYGFDGIETPNLDRLAREGVLFEQAVSPAPLTLPAHSSIFTGTFPPAHGVRDNGGFFLDERETTLAERLQARGFTTGGFVGAYVLDHKWGIAQGFQTYFDDFDLSKYQSLSLGSVDRPGNEVADKALAWLDSVGSQRFFGWVHFYDAHSPYDPPEPFKSRYAGHPYIGEIAFVDSQVGRLLAYLDAHHLAERHRRRRHGRSRREPRRARRGRRTASSSTRRRCTCRC